MRAYYCHDTTAPLCQGAGSRRAVEDVFWRLAGGVISLRLGADSLLWPRLEPVSTIDGRGPEVARVAGGVSGLVDSRSMRSCRQTASVIRRFKHRSASRELFPSSRFRW
jgi:hypothetical protein